MPSPSDRQRNELLNSVQAIGPYATLGIELVFFIVVFFFLGRWADSKLGTAPWLMIVGVFMGVGGGLFRFIQTVTVLARKEDELNEQRRHTGR
jgi:ATP synthase protein I